MSPDPTHESFTSDAAHAVSVLRAALADSPIPPKPIVELALDVCAAAGFPPTTAELDDKLRALGLLFGKAAPTSADLTHFLWHVQNGSVPLAICKTALAPTDDPIRGSAGLQTCAVLSAAAADLPSIYGDSLIKNLAVILRSVVRRAVEMTTAGMEGEVAAARSEKQATQQTVAALEADLTMICEAYRAAVVNPHETTAKAIADHIAAMTGSDRLLAWFQDLWSRTTSPEWLEPGSSFGGSGRRFEILESATYAALRDDAAKTAELRAKVENLQALLKADEEDSTPVTATATLIMRSVLIAAVEALGWTPAAGDPEDWALAKRGLTHTEVARQAALKEAHRLNLAGLRALIGGHETSDSAQVLRGAIDAITGLRERLQMSEDTGAELRRSYRVLANAIDPEIAMKGLAWALPHTDLQQSLLDRLVQIHNDAHTCEQHRRQVDHIDGTLERMLAVGSDGCFRSGARVFNAARLGKGLPPFTFRYNPAAPPSWPFFQVLRSGLTGEQLHHVAAAVESGEDIEAALARLAPLSAHDSPGLPSIRVA